MSMADFDIDNDMRDRAWGYTDIPSACDMCGIAVKDIGLLRWSNSKFLCKCCYSNKFKTKECEAE